MKERIYLASPHMSEEGYEQQYVKEAFDTNWIAPLGKNVNEFEKEIARIDEKYLPDSVATKLEISVIKVPPFYILCHIYT